MTRRLRYLVIGLAILTTVVAATTRTDPTDAAWTGRDHASATVGAGIWPSSGIAYAEMGRVSSASGLVFDLLPGGGGTALPWPGVTATRTQALPGASTATAAGPYRNGGVIGLVNELTSRGVATGSAIGGSTCASYTWGPTTIPPTASCPSAPQKVYATGTLSSYVLRADLLLGLGALNIVSIPNPVTATASCNLSVSPASNTAVAAKATDGTSSSQGTISIRGTAFAIPAAGVTTTFDRPSGLLVPRVAGSVTSSVTQSSTQARSTLTVEGTITYLGLVPITFHLVLADVACGTDASAVTPLAADVPAAARVAAPEPALTTTTPTTTTSTTIASTTESTMTTESSTTTATPTTDTPTTATPTTAATTTTTPPITAVPTTTTEPAPGTVFSGTDDGSVAKFVLTNGVTCSSDGTTTGDVAFTCSDGSTLTFDASALTTAGVDAAMVGGVWSPATNAGSTVKVSTAVRG